MTPPPPLRDARGCCNKVKFSVNSLQNSSEDQARLAQSADGFVLACLSGALFPSKSGLMNKHIVKHIVLHDFGVMTHFWVPCARLSPD